MNAISSAVAGKSGSGDPGPKVEIDRDWSKSAFCFIVKFLMGPVGYMVLKIMPYFMRFIWTIVDAANRIRYMLTSDFLGHQEDHFFIQVKMVKEELKW